MKWATIILLLMETVAHGRELVHFDSGVIESRATEIGGTYAVPQFPMTSALHAVSVRDGTQVGTGYSFTDSLLAFEPNDLLSGGVGSRGLSAVTVDFTPAADLHYEIDGSVQTGEAIWQNNPPSCGLTVRLVGPSAGLVGRIFSGSAPVMFVPGDLSTGSTIYSSATSGRLLPNNLYEFFASASIDNTGAGGAGDLAGHVQLHFSLFGDFNGDRRVGFADLLIVAQHYGVTGSAATYEHGNTDEDGNVGFDDVLAVAQRYGEDFSDAVPIATTPDPQAASWIFVGAVVVLRKRRCV